MTTRFPAGGSSCSGPPLFFHLSISSFSMEEWRAVPFTISTAITWPRYSNVVFSEIGELEVNRENILEYMKKDKWLAVGEVVFKANCVSCHGADGGGLVGPNLTDDNWKNVSKVEDIATVIMNGAAKGAMPAWKNRLSHPNQFVLTAAYVARMREKPVSGKAPEGDIIIKSWE